MFPRPNLYSHGFNYQHPAFLPLQGLMMQQPQQRMLPFNNPAHQQQRMAMSGEFMMSSPIRPFMNSPNRGRKRNAHGYGPNNKRRKMTAQPQQMIEPHISQEPNSDEKFVVPVSKGTEQITIAIWTYFLENQMTEEDLRKKLLLRKNLHSVAEHAFRNCRLFIVGSSMTGFATRTSDVDMCLMISQREIDQKGHATMILNSILRALRTCNFMSSPQVIRAKVPILKFFDNVAGVECDLNVNNTIGVRNTHLLRYYAYMDWRVRPLMLFIKRWARFHDINDASKKTISSYSLTLMLIHYLQVGITPPVLPCLQRMRPDLFHPRSDVRNLSLKMDDNVKFDSQNGATLGELFLGFLNYYTNIFNWNTDVISVRMGKRLDRRGFNSHEWKFLNIEEPFERSNTARSVYDHFVFMRILRVFAKSFRTLESQRNIDSIMRNPF